MLVVLSEYLRLAGLRVSEVHGLIQQLIHHHEVITNALLFELSEVVLEHLQSSQVKSSQVKSSQVKYV